MRGNRQTSLSVPGRAIREIERLKIVFNYVFRILQHVLDASSVYLFLVCLCAHTMYPLVIQPCTSYAAVFIGT